MSGDRAVRPSDVPEDGRARRGREHRDRVYRAALELFVERGYERTSMDDIARRAGVARATVFNHFASKAAFVDEWSARRRARARAAVRHLAPDRDVRDRVGDYLLELARTNESSRPEVRAFLSAGVRSADEAGDAYLATELTALIRTAADRGETRPGTDPGQVGLLLTGAYYAVVRRWVVDPPPFDLTETLLDLLDIVVGGIRP